MGRGDKRSFKGKVFRGSYGNTRRSKEAEKATGATSGAAHAQPQQQQQQKKKA